MSQGAEGEGGGGDGDAPGPSSTLRGLPVRSTGSPIVIPLVSSYTWIVALSASIRMISPTSLGKMAGASESAPDVLRITISIHIAGDREGANALVMSYAN